MKFIKLYSLKIKASINENGIEKHISGAEKIVSAENLVEYSEALLNRALYHSKGKPDFINLKIETVRITNRIFLYRGDHSKKQKVLVRNIPSISDQTEPRKKNKWSIVEDTLENLKESNLYRSINEIHSAQSAHINFQGKDMLMLASNSYLDLSNDPQVKAYSQKIAEKYGIGSGGSRLTTGTTTIHNQLENLLAKIKGTEAALVYNTGYMANLGVISSLCSEDDIIFSDELNHASIIDGCRLSKAKVVVYSHNDMDDLEDKIRSNPCSKGLIVSDAVFSMDGDIVDLPRLVEIAEKYGLFSMIDEAHATGVIGEKGLGTVEYYHMDKNPDIIMGTLSKAIGSEGGFICGKQILIEYLKNKSRSFIFSTSLSPAVMASSIKAIELIMNEQQRVRSLQENIQYFCQCLREAGIDADSNTAIIPIVIGDDKKAIEISKELFEQGYYISAIRYPTVRKGSARLRVALMSTHTKEELKRAARTIGEIINKYGGERNEEYSAL